MLAEKPTTTLEPPRFVFASLSIAEVPNLSLGMWSQVEDSEQASTPTLQASSSPAARTGCGVSALARAIRGSVVAEEPIVREATGDSGDTRSTWRNEHLETCERGQGVRRTTDPNPDPRRFW